MHDPVAEQIKHSVWHGLLKAARLYRYYYALANRHRKRLWLKKGVQIIAGGLAVLASYEQLDQELLLPLAGAGVLAAVLLDWLLSEKTVILDTIARDLAAVESKYRTLFEAANTDAMSVELAKHQHEALEDQILQICARISVQDQKGLARRCQKEAYLAEEQRYGLSTP